jgi:hypothetical protein
MKVSTEIDNNFGYEKITQLVDNIPLTFLSSLVLFAPKISEKKSEMFKVNWHRRQWIQYDDIDILLYFNT